MPKAKSSRLAQVIAYFDSAELDQAEDILGIVRDRLRARKQGQSAGPIKAAGPKKSHHKKAAAPAQPVSQAADAGAGKTDKKTEEMDPEVAALVGAQQ